MHRHLGYYRGRRHVLGFWSDLPLDLKILVPLAFAGHLVAFASVIRLVLVRQELLTREELGE